MPLHLIKTSILLFRNTIKIWKVGGPQEWHLHFIMIVLPMKAQAAVLTNRELPAPSNKENQIPSPRIKSLQWCGNELGCLPYQEYKADDLILLFIKEDDRSHIICICSSLNKFCSFKIQSALEFQAQLTVLWYQELGSVWEYFQSSVSFSSPAVQTSKKKKILSPARTGEKESLAVLG